MKLAEQMRNSSRIVSLHQSVDSTLQWGAQRGLLCLTLLTIIIITIILIPQCVKYPSVKNKKSDKSKSWTDYAYFILYCYVVLLYYIILYLLYQAYIKYYYKIYHSDTLQNRTDWLVHYLLLSRRHVNYGMWVCVVTYYIISVAQKQVE